MDEDAIRQTMDLLGLAPANPAAIAAELKALAARLGAPPRLDDDPTLFAGRPE